MKFGWHQRAEAVVDNLIGFTIKNKIDWRSKDLSDEFYAEVGTNVVSVESISCSPDFILHIYDGAYGERIGSTSPDIFADDQKLIPKLKQLHELARRKAMNAGEQLQKLLDFLEKEYPDEDST